jgi:tRNA U34 5-carboxymethylaminomethyl modifying enzyme MnmG/GidA
MNKYDCMYITKMNSSIDNKSREREREIRGRIDQCKLRLFSTKKNQKYRYFTPKTKYLDVKE